MVGCQSLQRNGGRLVEIHAVGDWDKISGRRRNVSGVAPDAKQRYDPVTLAHVFDVRSNLCGYPRDLRAGHERERGLLEVLVPATYGVGVVDPSSLDLDEHLVLARGRFFDLDEFQHVRLAELADLDRLH